MPNGPIRRTQLIAPFGPGGLTVTRDGISVISAGLDHWYEREDNSPTYIDEYLVHEWRLERRLDVTHFRLPPDYRLPKYGLNVHNNTITVPFLRFPQWHFCPSCNRLYKLPLTQRGKIICQDCLERKKKRKYLYQVPFIAICDQGHIQDFPWNEWVHESISPQCNKPLRLVATGGASLAGQIVKCDCGKQRSLSQITSARESGDITELTAALDKAGSEYRCQGIKPWLGTEQGMGCGRPIRGSLRSASNVYFASVRSSIYLPRSTDFVPPDLVSLLEKPPVSVLLDLLLQFTKPENIKPEHIRNKYPQALEVFSDAQIQSGLSITLGQVPTTKSIDVESDDSETKFRRMEFNVLREVRKEPDLVINETDLDKLDTELKPFFSRIMLVGKLRETRALVGFTRVVPDDNRPLQELKGLLWRHTPDKHLDWLPAYIVYGEGIFIELNETLLSKWESQKSVKNRIAPLQKRYSILRNHRGLRDRPISPRFVLVHTIAHLLMNCLTFECGYSSAALRERLYISDNTKYPMAAFLLYTAAGDAEGTMGGLVRMGKPEYIQSILRRAVDNSKWCSADPVCMEISQHGGQGPDSFNLAACHNCALVPETACEEFNRFLDRGMIIGEFDTPNIGYFSDIR